jgi:hypothetical protein
MRIASVPAAKVLTEQGTQRDARFVAIVVALERWQGNAAVGTAISNPAELLAAIAASSALRANPKRNRG